MATYTITNLLTNSSFENTGWAANSNATISYVTNPVHSGSYALKVNSTSSSETLIVTSGTLPLIDEHIYYCGVYFWEDTAVCSQMQVYWPIAEPTWGDSFVDSTKLGQWQRLGWRIIRSAWSSSSYQFRFNFEGMASETYVYIDDAVLIDLTACFGSGNEPSRAWCDEFIPYFTGTTTINYNKYTLGTKNPTSFQQGDVIECPYVGSIETLVLPAGKYLLETWGAQGGSYNSSYATGGLGGYSRGILNLKKPTSAFISAGGAGSYGTSRTYTAVSGGGWNGGGNSGYRGGAGGGASDICIKISDKYARVIVAGGGGGAYAYSTTYKAAGGAGGGESGLIGGYYSSSYTTYRGNPGTQTAGGNSGTAVTSGNYNGGSGTFGFGGSTGYKYNSTSYYASGAGGGGWYGGGAADHYNGSYSRTRYASGGGGGSGYVYTEATASSYPQGCRLSEEYYLTDAYTKAGDTRFLGSDGTTYETGHSGAGHVRVSILSLNSQKYIKVASNGVLPSGYTQLNYIESDGTQYIDTGFTPDYNTKLEMIASPNDVSDANTATGGIFYGAGESYNSKAFECYTQSGQYEFNHGDSTLHYLGYSAVGQKLIISHTPTQVSLTINENDAITSIHTQGSFTAPYTLTLFGIHRSSVICGKSKIYSCKIYNGSSLIRNFIPAMRNSDSMIGMYDLINNKFYIDAAGGNFAGNAIDIDSSTILLLNGENLTDQSSNNRTITNNGVTVSTAEKKFNSSSMYFNGSSSIYISPYNFGNNDFTIDWWECPTSTSAKTRFCSVYGTDSSTLGGLLLYYNTNGLIYMSSSVGSPASWDVISGWSAMWNQENVWSHVAVVRKGQKLYVFHNGMNIAWYTIGTSSVGFSSSYNMCIGDCRAGDHAYYIGYLDNFRISKVARWISDFEPPALEYGNGWRLIDNTYIRTNVSWAKEE